MEPPSHSTNLFRHSVLTLSVYLIDLEAMKTMTADEYTERNSRMHEFFLGLGCKDLKATAKVFGLNVQSVRAVMKKKGEKFPKTALHKNSACALNAEKIFRMNDAGASLAAMAREVGTKGMHVRRFLREHGKDRHFPLCKGGAEHYNWKGGRRKDSRGYIHVLNWNHPRCNKHTGYVYEHTLVMEKHIGRYMLPGEVVHHRNGNPSDNRIENLELFSRNSEHLAKELKGRCPNWTLDGIHRMQESLARRAKKKRERIHFRLKRDVSQSQ